LTVKAILSTHPNHIYTSNSAIKSTFDIYDYEKPVRINYKINDYNVYSLILCD